MAATPTPDDLQATADLLTRLVDAGYEAGKFVVVAAAIYAVGRLVVVPLAGRLTAWADVEETLRSTLLRVLDAAFVVFAVYVAVTLSGLATTPNVTAAFAAAATIALGFAAQDVLGNLVSGAFIVTDPKFRIGDWIQWNGREGIVEDIGFRVTRVHTFDNELITVPNSQLTDNVIVNPVAKDRRRITVTVGVGYDEDLEAARECCRSVADDHPEILDRPRATARVTDLSESWVEITVRFWIDHPARTDFVRVRGEFIQGLKERLDDADIEMPYPIQELTGEVGTWDADGAAGPEPGE